MRLNMLTIPFTIEYSLGFLSSDSSTSTFPSLTLMSTKIQWYLHAHVCMYKLGEHVHNTHQLTLNPIHLLTSS